MKTWSAPQRPVAYVEHALLTSIIEGDYLPGTNLPAERELAIQLGVTRPTLREALRRLESDGWLTVQQGKPTRVNDFWRDGGLNVLSSLVRCSQELPPNFIPNLLDVRLVLAPAYTQAAVHRSADALAAYLAGSTDLADQPAAYAAFDWRLHYNLTVWSENPIYTLILNGFAGFYEQMAQLYFAQANARRRSQAYYTALHACAQAADAQQAETLTRQVMQESIDLWNQTLAGGEE